jgi:hypothetical protein
VVLCRDVASVTVNQLDRCNLLRRSIVCSGTGKTSYWSVLRMNLFIGVLSCPNFRRRVEQSRPAGAIVSTPLTH